MVKTVYKAAILNPITEQNAQFYSTGYLSVAETGKITNLSQEQPLMEIGDELVTLEGRLIAPGFVDTHAHIPQFQSIGEGRGTPLLEWLKKYIFPAEMRFKDPQVAKEVSQNFFNHAVARGTTMIAAYSSSHKLATEEAFRVAHRKGIRAFIGKVMMDRNAFGLEERTDASLNESFRLFEEWDGKNNGKLRYLFTPRFAPTCTPELLREVGDIARRNHAYVQTHLSENREEIIWVKGLFPNSKSYTDVYAQSNLLGEKTIMAHCIHLDAGERRLLKETNTKIAHCPDSNQNLRSGTMPYHEWRSQGLTVGLGSDIAGGRFIGMNHQMKKAQDASAHFKRAMPYAEAFYLATLGGANVLGMGNTIGNFETGKEADFIVINPGYTKHNPIKDANAALGFLMHHSRGRRFVEDVYVRGELIHSRIQR
jgi:guanine deaminase